MAILRRVLRLALFVVLALILFGGGWLAGRLGIGSVVNPSSLTEAERQFSDRMRNVTMVGTFTVAGRENRTPSPDRYEISSVERLGTTCGGSTRRWTAAGWPGQAMPIVVPMRFVGDTPSS